MQALATLLRSPRCVRAASANVCPQSLCQRGRWELIPTLGRLSFSCRKSMLSVLVTGGTAHVDGGAEVGEGCPARACAVCFIDARG